VLLNQPQLMLPLAQLRIRDQEGTGGIIGVWARSWEMQREEIWSCERLQEGCAHVFEKEVFTFPIIWF